jgi:actin-related protein
MLAEPTAQPDRDREEVVERVFEGRGPPALFLARDAVLSSFATGRATAMVVDAGHDSTTGEPCFFPCF